MWYKLNYPISIHAPHAGRDLGVLHHGIGRGFISIHAPHAGRDQILGKLHSLGVYFNPRAPCGARPMST